MKDLLFISHSKSVCVFPVFVFFNEKSLPCSNIGCMVVFVYGVFVCAEFWFELKGARSFNIWWHKHNENNYIFKKNVISMHYFECES